MGDVTICLLQMCKCPRYIYIYMALLQKGLHILIGTGDKIF